MPKTSFSIAGVAMLIAAAMFALAGVASADSFEAPLLQCQAVTSPAALSNCAGSQDPLKSGSVTINNQGDVTVIVNGAATNTQYDVALVSNDGTQSASIGPLMTNAHGNGAISKSALFKFGTVGAGNVVVTSGAGPNNEEFVTGILISSNGTESGRDFRPSLVRCTDVTTPGTLSNCGGDSLSSGRVDVENPDGALSIHIFGARPSTNYTAFLRPQSGSPTNLGSFGTNKSGNGTLIVSAAFAAGTVASGQIVLQSGGTDQFVSGFKVSQHFVRPDVAVSNLVECGDVTNPPGLTCGTDPLNSGNYRVNTAGAITVELKGAAANTNYEVWFRPLDNSGDVDTGLKVATDKHGNGHANDKKTPFFGANSVDSGTLVIKQQADSTLDQFVAGFKTR